MSRARSHEEKVSRTVEKITKGLSIYFKEKVRDKCANLRDVDPIWFDQVSDDCCKEFENLSLMESLSVLRRYDINSKGLELDEANEKLRHRTTWRPSGNPSEDIRAHLLPIDKSHAENLSVHSRKLSKDVATKYRKLRQTKCELQKELDDFQSLSDKLADLTNTAEQFLT